MVVAPCLTVKPQPDRSLVTEPSVFTMRSCGLLFSSMRSLSLPCWPFSIVLSQIFWQEFLVETPESIWVPFPLLGLLELCQLAYLPYWVLCLTHPGLASTQPVSLCVFYGFVECVVVIFDDIEVRLWPDPLSVWFVLVGRLAWTSWSQWVCPWWFPVWLALPRSALCPAFTDLSVPATDRGQC